MAWSLYEKEGKVLEPLVFSNGKSQADVVDEVLKAIDDGNKVIFIHGVCGTGKSAIALNIARQLGKSSIIVPGKNLQAQYQKDYEVNKYLLKESKLQNIDVDKFPKLKALQETQEKLKIKVITGRGNHKCKFLEDNKNAVPVIKKETNSSLHDIFAGRRAGVKELIGQDLSANNHNLPCKIEIKEKNWNKIKTYLKQNKRMNVENLDDIRDVGRAAVACACPYWSPVLPEKYSLKIFADSKKRSYLGLEDTKFVCHKGKEGCKFYEQFDSFVNSDVIVFNSMKYVLESAMNRKPSTEVEIIDECDEFLDKFSNQRNINIDRLQNALVYVFGEEKVEIIIKEISELVKEFKRNERINHAVEIGEIIPLKETGIYDLLKIFLTSNDFLAELDDESYLFEVEETAKMFEDFMDESYVTLNKSDTGIIVNVVTTNLAKKFQEMKDKNKILVLMSGTLHSDNVLKNIFGLEDYVIIDAEVEGQGEIEIVKTGLERDFKYSNRVKFSRKDYLDALSKCVEKAKRPVLVHVNAYADLPTEQELEEYDIDNLISREKLRETQDEDKTGELVERFKMGQSNVLFSTRSARGMDFPGEQCNSIIFTKYPNPNVQDAFWKILNKTKPQFYWEFYRDKARRELWQKIYRGLRFKEDHVYLLSPDVRVLDAFSNP